eukprot:COSAG02_NODE_841_length_16613_cov_61.635703_8_plen_38_part_00
MVERGAAAATDASVEAWWPRAGSLSPVGDEFSPAVDG